MPTTEKIEKTQDLVEALKKAQIAFVAEYQGLTVADVSSLRRELKKNQSEMKIAKNTLAKRAVKEAGYAQLTEHLKGPIAFFLGYDSAVSAPKIVFAFAKDNESLILKAGYYAGKLLRPEDIEALANLPSMTELQGMLYRILSAPSRNFLMMVQAPLRELILTLEGLAKKKSESES